jgi:CRP/FNR family transcriptional regulator, cyclic AMP receptor protein
MRSQAATTSREQEKCRDLLRRHFLLRDAAADVIDKLIPLATIVAVDAGKDIFLKGDPGYGLYGILAGQVRIYVLGHDSNEVTLNILDPGELFGEIALIDGEPRSASAAAVVESQLMHIRRDRFLPLLLANANIGVGLLQVLCRRVRSSSALAEDQALLPIPARLAKRLLKLAEARGRQTADGIRLESRLSQRELGELIGATRETVNRILAVWQKSGLIDSEGGRIILRHPEALASMAHLD